MAATPASLPTLPAERAGVFSTRTRRLCLVLLLLWLGVTAFEGWKKAGRLAPDFEYFYKGGASLLTSGTLDPGYDVTPTGQVVARDSLKWYLPAVPRLMTLVAWLPPREAGWLWFGLLIVATIAAFRLITVHVVAWPAASWPVALVVPCTLLTAFWHWEFHLSQINIVTLLLMVGAFACARRGHDWAAGFWLGLAVLIKISPGLLVVWFALKRRGRVVIAALATMLLAGPVSDAAIYGPQQTIEHYGYWLHTARTAGSQRGLVMSQTEMDWRNQGMGAVLCRWLHPTNYALRYDNDPRLTTREPEATMNVARLSLGTVANIAVGLQLVMSVLLVWLTRRPARELSDRQMRFEWVLYVLGMLWIMPVLRAYHLIWATPAVALLLATTWSRSFRGSWTWLALICAGLLVPVQLALKWTLPQAAGLLLAQIGVLAVPVIAMLVGTKRGSKPPEPRERLVADG